MPRPLVDRPTRARGGAAILAAILLTLAVAGCGAERPTEPAAPPAGPAGPRMLRWSDPASWPGGAVPAAGATVTIAAGRTVLLDVTPPPLGSLVVDGALEFDRRDLALRAERIVVAGALRVGTEAEPFLARATITLTGRPDAEAAFGMTSNAIAVMPGGTLDLHGAPRVAWTRLDATAEPGATRLTLERAVDWQAGDRVVVAATDFDPAQYDEAVVAAVDGRAVTLARPLRYRHWGVRQTVAGRVVDERAEVGLLSRNVVVRGDDACAATGYCAHVVAFRGGTLRVEGTELSLVGQKGIVARYPIHWHVAQEVPGQYARGNGISRSFNRCVTVHGSHEATVRDNVCHDFLGHGYFLEDGNEVRNTLAGNLGVYARTPPPAERVLPSDATPATFWITNPDNVVRGNVAAGSTGWGFWYALPEHPTGPSATDAVWPRRTPLGTFAGNVAHSNRSGALNVDHGPLPDGTTATTSYQPRAVPGAESPAVTATFEDLVAYKHRGRAVWLRGRGLRLVGAVLADNGIGATFAASDTYLQDALVVGVTANDATALPNGFPARGFEFYDGTVGARRVTFANFVASARGPASAVGFNRSNAFPLSTLNFVEEVTYLNANAAYVEDPKPDKDGDKAAVFLDRDGAATGTPGHYVVAGVPLLLDASCARRPAWNAHACAGPYGRLQVASAAGEPVAPATVTRDDGAALALAGSGNRTTSLSLTVPLGRAYTLALPAAVTRPRLTLSGLRPGQWARVALPFPYAALTATRAGGAAGRLTPAASLAELDASAGDRYHLAGGVLHLKLVAPPDRDVATVAVEAR